MKVKEFFSVAMQKLQKFGGAMVTPVLMFSFAGIMVGFSIIFTNPFIMGSLANESTVWFKLWTIILEAAWTVFRHTPLLFAVALPIGLAKKQNARACMESVVLYLTFNYFINSILTLWGSSFGVNFEEGITGITTIAGIQTLDMGIVGALLVSGIVVWLHNRFFDTKLPDFLGIFKGSVFIFMIGFFILLPVAFICAVVWPQIQNLIVEMQQFFIRSGEFGVGIYGFLERFLIPTGLHHFINVPFVQGSAAIDGGIALNWTKSVSKFANSTESLRTLFPAGGFALYANPKIFGSIGLAIAFYATAKPEKKKTVLSLLIPATLTAVLCGVTEPLEFTFLFVAPILFFIHAVLAGIMQALMYSFGISGLMNGGLIELVTVNWLPLFNSHGGEYIKQILIGLLFVVIYFFLFKFLITKFDFKTPGREDDAKEIKFYTKKDYIEQKNSKKEGDEEQKAAAFLENLGGAANIIEVTNCMTRLRLTVADASLVKSEAVFKECGAQGLVIKGDSIQVIVGLSVPTVREHFENLMNEEKKESAKL